MKTLHLFLLLLVLLSACIPVAGSAPDPGLGKLAGAYHCMGHEAGMIAGFGAFTITKDGKLNDGQNDWALTSTATPLTYTVANHPQFDQLIIQKDGTFNIAMKPGLKVAHADDGYVWCARDQ
jgi:hypothetical protein